MPSLIVCRRVQESDSEMVDGRNSPPPTSSRTTAAINTLPLMAAKEKPPINVVGDVGGKIAIMVRILIRDTFRPSDST